MKATTTKALLLVPALLLVLLAAGCKEQKKTDDIIVPKQEVRKPQGPVRMQPYNDMREVGWLERKYTVEVNRVADDSLARVKDEQGQLYVDNRISVTVRRADGSVAIAKTFTKAAFEAHLDDQYRRQGILEGLVFDRVDGQQLCFAASVSLPQSEDEYIPLEVRIDSFGNVSVRRDSQMDTYGASDEDDV